MLLLKFIKQFVALRSRGGLLWSTVCQCSTPIFAILYALLLPQLHHLLVHVIHISDADDLGFSLAGAWQDGEGGGL